VPSVFHSLPLADALCAHPQKRGQAELTLVAGFILRTLHNADGKSATHLSINCDHCRPTMLTDTNVLTLSQATLSNKDQLLEYFKLH